MAHSSDAVLEQSFTQPQYKLQSSMRCVFCMPTLYTYTRSLTLLYVNTQKAKCFQTYHQNSTGMMHDPFECVHVAAQTLPQALPCNELPCRPLVMRRVAASGAGKQLGATAAVLHACMDSYASTCWSVSPHLSFGQAEECTSSLSLAQFASIGPWEPHGCTPPAPPNRGGR